MTRCCGAVLIVFLAFSISFAHVAAGKCRGGVVPDDVSMVTAKAFLRSQGEPDYAEFEYRVLGKIVDGCRVVAVAVTPDAFDSEILVFIGRRGVVRAVSPDGEPFFDVRGDRLSGLARSTPFPLVAEDESD